MDQTNNEIETYDEINPDKEIEKQKCNPYRELTIEELEEIESVGDITIINPPDYWKKEWPLSLSQLGIPNWKFLIYEALKDSGWQDWTFRDWEGDFEDNEYIYCMINSVLYDYDKAYNNDDDDYKNKINHPFLKEYYKIMDFFRRAQNKQFIIR
jgi:hypothetical protein